MHFPAHFWTCAMGSFPHPEASKACRLVNNSLDIPIWPQLPRRSFLENMYVQFSASLPAIQVDEQTKKIYFDTSGDLPLILEPFYAHYLSEDLDWFGLRPAYSSGLGYFIDHMSTGEITALPDEESSSWVKGQVTGPLSMGLTITDQNLRASLYDELLADVLVKNAQMNARWQIRRLKDVKQNVIIFIDEPFMASIGSAYISISSKDVVSMLDEVIEGIHGEGALAAVHCCGNTDWSALLSTGLDILSLDAHSYLDNLSLYPAELRSFIDRGGVIAWGIVPNNDRIRKVSAQELSERLFNGMALIGERAKRQGVKINPEEFAYQSLITPSCGLGPATVDIAEQSMGMLRDVGEALREVVN